MKLAIKKSALSNVELLQVVMKMKPRTT